MLMQVARQQPDIAAVVRASICLLACWLGGVDLHCGPSTGLNCSLRALLLQKEHIRHMMPGLPRDEVGLQLPPAAPSQQCSDASEAFAVTMAGSNAFIAQAQDQQGVQLHGLAPPVWTDPQSPQLPPQQGAPEPQQQLEVQQQCWSSAAALPAATRPSTCSPTTDTLQLPERAAPLWPAGLPFPGPDVGDVGGAAWESSVLPGGTVYSLRAESQVAPGMASAPSMPSMPWAVDAAASAAAGSGSGDRGPLGGLGLEVLALLDAPGALDDLLLAGEDFM
jgi:hypothetical protein